MALGPIMTLLFECLDTVRFQVQEMARVEKIISDEAIQVELDIYNRLLPAPGELSATLFIELTSEAELRGAGRLLVGIETQVGMSMDGDVVMSVPEAEHGAALTRDSVTPAVHYLRFVFSQAQVAAFGSAAESGSGSRRTRPMRLGRSWSRRSARNCWGTCSAQQRPSPSPEQGQFCAPLFTGARSLGHTLRSPNSELLPSVYGSSGPPTRGRMPLSRLKSIRKCFR